MEDSLNQGESPGEWTFCRKIYAVRDGKSGYPAKTDALAKSVLMSEDVGILSLGSLGSRLWFR